MVHVSIDKQRDVFYVFKKVTKFITPKFQFIY